MSRTSLRGEKVALALLVPLFGCSLGVSGSEESSLGVQKHALTLTGTELLGRPTDTSVTVQALADGVVEAYFEYGTVSGVYTGSTGPVTFANGTVETVIDGLDPDTRYYYRMRYRDGGSAGAFSAGTEHSFHTQRAPGSTFTFDVQSDSHQGFAAFYSDALYGVTEGNILSDQPDLLFDLGDTFSLDDGSGSTTDETEVSVRQKYLDQRSFFTIAGHSTAVFLVLGNHENEEGWNLNDFGANMENSLPVLGANARKRYFVNPVPDEFYTGNLDASVTQIDGDHLKEDYYAFQWGDALFVAIDPFWYTMKKPYANSSAGGELDEPPAELGDRWDWTLGIAQYLWLQQTLEQSTAKYKFVFAHQLAGGTADYSRAGARGARYVEWGGYDTDGVTWGFDTKRPAAQGWTKPIHQLFVDNHVSIFFHGHDHIFAQEELDGVVYQECPHPANDDYGSGFSINATSYADAVRVNNSGHLRVTVSRAGATVDYVRAYLPADEGKNGHGFNRDVAYTYTVEPICTSDSDCDDGDPCTTDECNASVCSSVPVVCDDGDECTQDSCDESGACAVTAVVCDSPPAPYCSDANHLVSYLVPAPCDPDHGCQYAGTSAWCEFGCNGATLACNPDPCLGVSCVTPPGNGCFGATGACDGGTCTYPALPVGTACTDGNPCTTGETCTAGGSCTGGTATPVDDGNACTADSCNTTTGVSHVPVADGTGCDADGNRCNGYATCHSGACMNGPAVTCQTPPAGGCYGATGTCNPANGACSYLPLALGTGCDDGDPCTVGDQCDGYGSCRGSALECSPPDPECVGSDTSRSYGGGACDGGVCTFDSVDTPCAVGCSDATGLCKADPCAGVACASAPGQCYQSTGTCSGGECSYPPRSAGASCDDGDPCTAVDQCTGAGSCRGTPLLCNTPPSALCVDASTSRHWDADGMCSAGECGYAQEDLTCEHGCDDATGLCREDPCTNVTCDEPAGPCEQSTGTCSNGECSYGLKPSGSSCDDADPCTTSDACSEDGECTGEPKPCHDPPVPTCDGATSRAYEAAGSCDELGECVYTLTETPCAFGCDEGSGLCHGEAGAAGASAGVQGSAGEQGSPSEIAGAGGATGGAGASLGGSEAAEGGTEHVARAGNPSSGGAEHVAEAGATSSGGAEHVAEAGATSSGGAGQDAGGGPSPGSAGQATSGGRGAAAGAAGASEGSDGKGGNGRGGPSGASTAAGAAGVTDSTQSKDSDAEGGCGCSVPGSGQSGWWLALVPGALAVMRSRRRVGACGAARFTVSRTTP